MSEKDHINCKMFNLQTKISFFLSGFKRLIFQTKHIKHNHPHTECQRNIHALPPYNKHIGVGRFRILGGGGGGPRFRILGGGGGGGRGGPNSSRHMMS